MHCQLYYIFFVDSYNLINNHTYNVVIQELIHNKKKKVTIYMIVVVVIMLKILKIKWIFFFK